MKWVYIPGSGSAMTLPYQMKINDAKQFIRDFLNVNRLPNGTTFWE